MMVDATEDKEQEKQSTTKENKDGNFISAPGLSSAQIDELWDVAINTCYRLGYSVNFKDRKSNNLSCQGETQDRESIYTLRVWFNDSGIQVDSISNSIANLVFGSIGTKRNQKIMIESLEDKLAKIYTQRGNHNRSNTNTYSTQTYKVQQQLTELNYDPGPSDGFMGSRTRKAIMNFQQDNNITPTGIIDEITMQKLNSLSKK
jgi:hypothetical protein